MSNLKYSIAMLAAGGAMGAVSYANAAEIFPDIAIDAPLTQITIVGSTPQFDYGEASDYFTSFGTDYQLSGGTMNSGVGLKTATPGLPTSGETYDPTVVYTTGYEGFPLFKTNTYIHVSFEGNGIDYVGTAFIDESGTLESITYNALPEPEVWTLLMAGVGLAGAGLRRSRRRQPAAIA